MLKPTLMGSAARAEPAPHVRPANRTASEAHTTTRLIMADISSPPARRRPPGFFVFVIVARSVARARKARHPFFPASSGLPRPFADTGLALPTTPPRAIALGAPVWSAAPGPSRGRLEPASASDSKIRGFAVDGAAPCVTRRPQKSPVGAKIRASSLPETGSGRSRVIFVQQWPGND